MAAGRLHTGTVAEFDEAAGLGTVLGDDGRDLPFHCTAIADGTRTIEVDARVVFEVRPGPGRWEARALTRVGGRSSG